MSRRRHHPADIGARIATALVGGYLLTLYFARALAAHLPLVGREASISASLAAWLMYVGVAMWAFAARSLWAMAAPLLLLGGVLLLLVR